MKVMLKLPRVSTNMEEATVVSWYVEVGAAFKKGDPLYAIETEKAVADIEAPCDGTLLEINAPVDSIVEVGATTCAIDNQ